MEPLTLLKRSPWTYLLLLLWVVKLSHQIPTNGCSDDTLEDLKNLILGRLDDMDYKLKHNAKMVEEKTLLTFNPTEMTLVAGQEANLHCGVIGIYESCQWEHSGLLYQLIDVANGSHVNMRAASNSINNQCGITIISVSTIHDGVWTCKVLSFGQTLTASKTILIENTEIIFNQLNVSLYVGQEANLNCGVVGSYRSCQWEHGGHIYQFANVTNRSHSYMKEALNSNGNQCGITITSVSTSQDGVWTCTVLTAGHTLTASKSLTIEKNEIIFDSTDISLNDNIGKEVNLECGVIGVYYSCNWEHAGHIYQLADVTTGSHSNMRTASNNITNQCGIIINFVYPSHDGVWTCKVLTFGHTLNASKTLNIGCPEGFFPSKDAEQCFKMFKDEKRTWQEAKTKCETEGLLMAMPLDAVHVNLRKYLSDPYGDYNYFWLDARMNGTKILWQRDGTELRSDNPLWDPGHPERLTHEDYCVYLAINLERPYSVNIHCYSPIFYTLCEMRI